MKSPTNGPESGRTPTEHARPMSCRGSAMQRDIANAVRHAYANAPRYRQSDRVKGVIANDRPSCPVLEAVIDERIKAGADADAVLEIGHIVLRHIREKLIAERPEYAAMVRELDLAMVNETVAQGPQDVATVESLGAKCLNSLKNLWHRSTQHRNALDLVIVAAEREMAARDAEHARVRHSFNLAPRGRAS